MTPLLLLLAWPALAAPSDPVLEAMTEELARIPSLTLEGAPGAYYASYRVFEGQHLQLKASLGGLISYNLQPYRSASVAVRVGSPQLDNGNFSSTFNFSRGFEEIGLVQGDDALALRHDLWLSTDGAYKGAVQNLARKMAARKGEIGIEPVPSFVLTPPVEAVADPAPALDPDALEALARALSARFLDHPEVEQSRVEVAGGAGRSLLADTGGTRLIQPATELDLRVIATARAEDGRTISDHASWIVPGMAGLPSRAELESAADALAGRLERWRSAPAATEPYVGPVIFEGEAAVDLFRRLLVPALESTPPMERARNGRRRDDEAPGAMALKRRVLPEGFTVEDDPTADPSLASSYAYDEEGVPAQRVTLVSDGIVHGLLASRIPSQDAPTSNGHGRSPGSEEIGAMPSFLRVGAGRTLSARKLTDRALKMGKDYDLDRVLVVRRLVDPSVQDGGGSSFVVFFGGGGSKAEKLPDPLDVVFRYADGHEEPVRGLSWNGADRRTLRDIVAAGSSTRLTYLDTGSAGNRIGSGSTLGVPVTLEAPSVLISELALDPVTGPAPAPPDLPNPLSVVAR